MKGWKKNEKVYFDEVIKKNPHLLASSIGIELLHGLHFLLSKDKAELASESVMNERTSHMRLYQEVRDFQDKRHGKKNQKSSSYSCPEYDTSPGGKRYAHMLVAKRCILDHFRALNEGRTIDIEASSWESTLKYVPTKETTVLSSEIIKLGTTKPPFGVNLAQGAVDPTADPAPPSPPVTIGSFDAEVANGAKRKEALRGTPVCTGDVVLGLVSGIKHLLDFDAAGKSIVEVETEMLRRRDAGKAVNLLVEMKTKREHKINGKNVISKQRGSYSKRSNPLNDGGALDEAMLTEAANKQDGFHPLENGPGRKKWKHKKMDKLHAHFSDVKKMLNRDVENTRAEDRVVFTTDAVYHGAPKKREPEMMKRVHTRIHEMRVAAAAEAAAATKEAENVAVGSLIALDSL